MLFCVMKSIPVTDPAVDVCRTSCMTHSQNAVPVVIWSIFVFSCMFCPENCRYMCKLKTIFPRLLG